MVVWGDGSPTREFQYVENAARGLVLATRESRTVRSFCEKTFWVVDIETAWEGRSVEEKRHDGRSGTHLFEAGFRCFRSVEVESLCGDGSRARDQEPVDDRLSAGHR